MNSKKHSKETWNKTKDRQSLV